MQHFMKKSQFSWREKNENNHQIKGEVLLAKYT